MDNITAAGGKDKMLLRIEAIFDEVVREMPSETKNIAPIKAILNNYDLRGKSVLEVACGIGDHLIHCVERGVEYAEGFDISGESIKLAKTKADKWPNVIFHKCALDEYVTDRKFDVILVLGVFEYLRSPFDSLKKIRSLLNDRGMMVILISKPIFIKRISFLFRAILGRVPVMLAIPMARFLAGVLRACDPVLKNILKLKVGVTGTYPLEQTILEGLMVPRYNIFDQKIFTDYLQKEGFNIEFFNNFAPSLRYIVAKRQR